MTTGFSKEETQEILFAKDSIKTYVDNTLRLYGWAQNIFQNRSSFYISGGAIASMLLKEAPKDFDVYCKTESIGTALKFLLTTSYSDHIKDVEENYRDVECWNIPGKMVTEKSITLNNNMSFIVMQYGEPEKIKPTFDFLHCTPHYDIAADKLYISRGQYDSIMSKTLVVNNPDQVTSWRMAKFIERGWTASEQVKALAALRPGSKLIQVNS